MSIKRVSLYLLVTDVENIALIDSNPKVGTVSPTDDYEIIYGGGMFSVLFLDAWAKPTL